ncbi:MAG: hypothetical protein P4L53_27910 [Candidatus Obscuribacterales bacterium]|nr:hypothetical protein [Candidatus Obscuribacterales bacterium]
MSNKNNNKTESTLPAEPLELQTRVLEDEYGDPIIAGPYSGQDQTDLDALYPGRQNESELDESKADEQAPPDETKKQGIQWKRTLLTYCAISMVGMAFTFALQSRKIQEVKEAARNSLSVAKMVTTNAQTSSLNAAMADAGTGASYSGDDSSCQQALALVKTHDEGMKLISIADDFLRKGDTKRAELLYRRALRVLGSSNGQTSWEYQQVLSRLSFLFQSKNRLQEEQEIKAYSKRLSGEEKN